jgi:neutral trehalase
MPLMQLFNIPTYDDRQSSVSFICQVGIAPAEGAQALAALAAFRRSGLLGPAGVATTDAATGQQWDAPNAWPPLQDIVIEALENYGGEIHLFIK